jgi:hypothetical protein
LSQATVAKIKAKTYSGKAIKPKPAVKLGGKNLKLGRDYTLSYKNNVSPGKARVVVTGKGNYKGSVSKTFTINPNAVKVNMKGYYFTWHQNVSSSTKNKAERKTFYVPKSHVLSKTHVEPLWYIVKMTGNYTGTTNKGNKVKLKRGSLILAIYRDSDGNSNLVVQDGTHRGEIISKVPSSRAESLATLTNSNIIYTVDTVEKFVNQKDIRSETNTMLWFNRGTQRLYVFKGRKGHWKVVKNCWNKEHGKRTLGCKANSESYAHYNSDSGNGIKNAFNRYALFHKDASHFQGIPRYIHYQSPGGSGIHAVGGTGRPSTHGCIAITNSNLDIVWNDLPTRSRVAVF